MKILHIAERFALAGGIETYLINLLPLLESRGCENVVIYRQSHERTLPPQNRMILYVPRLENAQEDAHAIGELVRQIKPSLVYMHDVYDPLMMQQVAQIAPSIGYVHIFYPVCPGLGKLYRRGDEICQRPFGLGCIPHMYLDQCASAKHPLSVFRIMQRTSAFRQIYRELRSVLVASTYMRDLMVQNGVPAQRVQVLPLFASMTDASMTDASTTDASTTDGAIATVPTQNPPTILFVGRLEYEKGIPYLLRSLPHIPTPHRLIIAGDGSRREEYVQLAAELGVAERVEFVGWASGERLTRLYQQASVVVMPTLMPEPFGIVGLEALTNGRPVVAFEVGGIPDWLIEGHNGFLVRPRDEKGLARRLEQLLCDQELAASLGQNGARYVKDKFSPERHVQGLIDVFQSVTKQP